MMKTILTAKTITHSVILVVLLASCSATKNASTKSNTTPMVSPLSMQNVDAALWFATSAENHYLFEQTYFYATELLKQRIPTFQGPLAPSVIIDLDETVLDNSPYQLELIRKAETFNEKSWNEWVMQAQAKALPGAKKFLAYCENNGIQVFYISNRESKHLEATMTNMTNLGLPFVSPEYILLKNDSSDKSTRRRMVMEKTTPILFLGDNLLDYKQQYADRTQKYGKNTVDLSIKEMLTQFIIFPNPMYGQWMKAFEDPNANLPDDFYKANFKIKMAKPLDD